MSSFDDLEPRLAARLHPTTTPAASETLRLLRPRLGDKRTQRLLPISRLRIAVAVLVALLATASLALASSSVLRQRLEVTSGVALKGNQLQSLEPPPAFQVFQPSYLPAGLQLAAQAYEGGVGSKWDSHSEGGDVGQKLAAVAQQRASLLADEAPDQLVLVYARAPDQFIELVQCSATGQALPNGDRVKIGIAVGVFTSQDGRDVVRWIEGGTYIQVGTTLGRDETLRIAEGLKPTPLAAFPVGSSALAVPQGLPTPVSVANRVVAVVTPSSDPRALTQACGTWETDSTKFSPQDRFDQVICVARKLTGMDVSEGYSASLHRWRDVARSLGLDPRSGPSIDTAVWLIDLEERGNAGTWAVVLDAQTGDSIAQVHLKPTP